MFIGERLPILYNTQSATSGQGTGQSDTPSPLSEETPNELKRLTETDPGAEDFSSIRRKIFAPKSEPLAKPDDSIPQKPATE